MGWGLSPPCTRTPGSRSRHLRPHWDRPLLPLWDHRATGAHPSTGQRMLGDRKDKKKTNKKISDRLNKSSSTRATARAIPSRAAHGARPPLPRASGRIFPSLHRRPGRNIAHIHRKEPPARYREMPETLLPGVSAWVRGGRGQERCRRPVFFPRETQWVLFCRESGGSSWKDIARAGAFLSPLPAHASPPGSSTVL